MPETVTCEVTGRVPIEGEHHVAGWVFPPSQPVSSAPLLCCLPGGSYTKAYWHLEVPGRPGYSFGEHLADQGMLVVALDHLGVGESSRHPRAVELTPDVVAAGNAAAFDDLVRRASDGTLIPGLGPLEITAKVGVGHSMGAMLAIFQQSLHASFDAIAPLGYGVTGPIIDFASDFGEIGVPSYEAIMDLARQGLFDGLEGDRSLPGMREHFYWDDVPADVIAADDLTNAHLPGVTGPLSIVPFIATDHAGRVRVPVFLGFGQRDSTPNAHDEPRAYRSSNDVTLFVLRGSAHCHNSANTRHELWDRLGAWVRALPGGTEVPR